MSGSPISAIKRPTKALMFIECPYTGNQQPHGSDDGRGVNMVFYDSHVAFHRQGDKGPEPILRIRGEGLEVAA